MNNIFYGWWVILACFILGIITGAFTFFGFTAFFDPLVKEFIRFVMSKEGQQVVIKDGYFPLPSKKAAEFLESSGAK